MAFSEQDFAGAEALLTELVRNPAATLSLCRLRPFPLDSQHALSLTACLPAPAHARAPPQIELEPENYSWLEGRAQVQCTLGRQPPATPSCYSPNARGSHTSFCCAAVRAPPHRTRPGPGRREALRPRHLRLQRGDPPPPRLWPRWRRLRGPPPRGEGAAFALPPPAAPPPAPAHRLRSGAPAPRPAAPRFRPLLRPLLCPTPSSPPPPPPPPPNPPPQGRALAYEGLSKWELALEDYDASLEAARAGGFKADPYILNSRGNVLVRCIALRHVALRCLPSPLSPAPSARRRASKCAGGRNALRVWTGAPAVRTAPQASLGRWEQARESYLQSAEIFQSSKGFRRGVSTTQRLDGAIYASANAALMRAQVGDDEGALRDAEAVARRAPNSADMRAAVAALLWGMGRQEEAEDAWQAREQGRCGTCHAPAPTHTPPTRRSARLRRLRRTRAPAPRGASATRTSISSRASAAGRR